MRIKKLQVSEYIEKFKNTATKKMLLDVRNPNELLEDGSIEQAINIPLANLPGNLTRISEESQVFVFCRNGPRAEMAAELLSNSEFKEIVVLTDGGISELIGKV